METCDILREMGIYYGEKGNDCGSDFAVALGGQ